MHRYLIMLIWETKLNWNCCQAIFVKPGYCWRPQLIISHQIYFLCQKVFLKLQTLGKDFFTSRQWCHAVFIMLLQMTFLHQTNAATTQRTQQLPEHDAQTGNPACTYYRNSQSSKLFFRAVVQNSGNKLHKIYIMFCNPQRTQASYTSLGNLCTTHGLII